MDRFNYASVQTLAPTGVNFPHIADAIQHETRAMLPTTAQSLEQSYRMGLSTAIIDTQTNLPVGHIRFNPLTTPELSAQLQLPGGLPDLWEIGTGYIDGSDGYREKGLYRMLRNAHMDRFQDELNAGTFISIGTTKSLRVLHTLHQSQREFGIEGIILPHTKMPFIAAFTCICKGDFGCGFHAGINACPQRIQPEQFPVTEDGSGIIDQMDIPAIETIRDLNGGHGKIPCTMYVQGRKDAIFKMEADLEKQFGTPENLIAQLRSAAINYYNEVKNSSYFYE